jgi:hypothetical protein
MNLLALDAARYEPHALHLSERIWSETNCYVDLWVELLHSLGLDPLAAAAFSVSSDFEGDQWTFFKFPPEDLRIIYGVEVSELNAWKPIVDHVEEHVQLGRLLTVEVDAWFLPDTQGVSYHIAHQKTTIVPNMVDRHERRLGYFHGPGYFELGGDDFDGIFRLGDHADQGVLPPYVEWIRLDRLRTPDVESLARLAADRLRDHLRRLPSTNPVVRFQHRLEADLPWLRAAGIEDFHQYAFGTCRQCGSAAELAADFVTWLASANRGDAEKLARAAGHYRSLAEGAKALQFSLARMARGREMDTSNLFAQMADDWDAASSGLVAIYGS